MRFELPPQLEDVDFQRVRQPVIALVPDVLVDPGPGENLAGVAEEVGQERIFFGREIEGVPGPLDALGGQVDRHVGRGQDGAGPSLRAAKHGAEPGQQFVERERLAEVVIRASIEPRDPVGDGVSGGQEQDGRVAVALAEAAEDRQAVLARQPPVEDHEIPVAVLQHRPGDLAIGDPLGDVPFLAQPSDDRCGDQLVVFDHQDADAHESVPPID